MSDKLFNVAGVLSAAVVANIKNKSALDLAVVSLPSGSKTAAVFTKNVFCAAPIIVAKNNLEKSPKAILINSGSANAGTGEKGIKNTLQTCKMLAQKLAIKPEQVLPFSTGVIGKQLDIDKFSIGISKAVKKLSSNSIASVAKSILTTDLIEKISCKQIKVFDRVVTITGIAKGSGMIKPDMATMLSFIFTDAKATQSKLQKCLSLAVEQSFNRITVDGDTSTNDACTLSATGTSMVDIDDFIDEFQQALNEVTKSLAHKIIQDGEGATKFVEVVVVGGMSDKDCLEVAYTVAHSPLVKTALFASDANWGRILAAVGRANISNLIIKDVDIYLNQVCVIKNGEPHIAYTEKDGNEQMKKYSIKITIKIGDSDLTQTVWTTDFSYDYVKINAEYRS